MRVDNHVHVRHIMLYHFEKRWKATESARDINELFGEGTIGERMVQKWFKRFKDGDTSIKNEEGRARVIESIEEKGWNLLPHPPYSSTEAPTDYHINRSLKNWMSNKVYDDLDELVDDVKAWIASKNRGFFERGIDMLPEKWEAVIEVDGEYDPE
uniref:Mos1 transposase HTH domain-containing protein n=1 Tax=Acrobeloides nanus TaxID=290746 RepID=A0A914E1N8_9BILA